MKYTLKKMKSKKLMHFSPLGDESDKLNIVFHHYNCETNNKKTNCISQKVAWNTQQMQNAFQVKKGEEEFGLLVGFELRETHQVTSPNHISTSAVVPHQGERNFLQLGSLLTFLTCPITTALTLIDLHKKSRVLKPGTG